MFNYVLLGLLDNFFSSIKDMSSQTLSIIMYVIGAFLVALALFGFAVAGYLLFKKKYKEALGRIGVAILVGFIAVLGAGTLFVYANYLGKSSGLNKSSTDSAVTNTLNQ